MLVRGLCLSTIAILLCSADAKSANYLPLEQGNFWTYETGKGDSQTITVDGEVEIFSRTLSKRVYSQAGADDGLQNFWISGDDGIVHLGGFHRMDDGLGIVYDPPILAVNDPHEVGDTWTQTLDYYSYPELVWVGSIDLSYAVYFDGVVATPLAEFPAYGIGQSPLGGAAASIFSEYSLSGEKIGQREAGGAATDWYSDQVGPVRYLDYYLVDTNVTSGPTPVRETTWGSVKWEFSGVPGLK